MRLIFAAGAVLILSACEAKEDAAPAPAEAAAQVTPASPPDLAPALTAEGWGAVRTGMSHSAAVDALGGKVIPDASTRGPDWDACHMIRPASPDGVWIMVENDKVTRVSVEARPGQAAVAVATDKGIKVGDPESKVREAYPAGLGETPHKYRGPPAKYLTWYARPAEAGIRYSFGEDGKVHAIAGGGRSIEYVEGCA